MTTDFSARRIAREAHASAENLQRDLQNLQYAFQKAVAEIDEMKQHIRQLQEELAPKKLDKPGNPFPLD